MRLRERDKRDVTVHAFTGEDDDAYIFGEGVPIRAAIYPSGQSLERMEYGQTVRETCLLLYDGDTPLEAGMGVALDDGVPAWQITSVQRWDHWRAVIEMIPPGKRG